MAEQERTPEEWAQELGVQLHGMTDERWNAYLRYLEGEGKDELAEVSKRLLEEAKDLHAAWNADKLPRPEKKEQRVRLLRGFRELRRRRLDDIRDLFEALYSEEETLND